MFNDFEKFCFLSVVMSCLMGALSIQKLLADGPTVEEIMARSEIAMRQSLQYTLVSSDGTEMVVYQKVLSNGSIAMLTNYPETKRMSLDLDEKNYEIDLEYQIVVDRSNILHNEQDQTSLSGVDLKNISSQTTYQLIDRVNYNGKECYEVMETISPEFKAAIWDKLSDDMKSRSSMKYRYLIDIENYFMQVRETLTEENGIVLKYEYKDISLRPDLSDELFQIPSGLEILTPQSAKEYASIIRKKWEAKHPPVDVEAEFEKVKKAVEERHSHRPKRDVRKEAEELSRQFKERVEELKKSIRQPVETPIQKAPRHRWVFVVSVNVIVIALLLVLWWLRRRTKK